MDVAPCATLMVTLLHTSEHLLLLCLRRRHASLAWLRERPLVSLSTFDEGNAAFTAYGRVRIVEESMVHDAELAAITIEVAEVNDHC